MPRTIAALYDSRAEAELARARLLSEAKIRAPRILAKDTAGAVDGLKFDSKVANSYRVGLRQGAHLLVAELHGGPPPRRIVQILAQSAGEHVEPQSAEPGSASGGQGVELRIPEEADAEQPRQPAAVAEPAPLRSAGDRDREAAPEWPPQSRTQAPPVEEERVPLVEEELRIGKREVARGGARVRSFTRETPAEEQISLRDEIIDIEQRPSDRRLADTEVEAGGLFKDRVFEIAEMREEPVVTKEAFVREEVIVRKRVIERTETIHDTIRHTEVEVEDLSAPQQQPRGLFGKGSRK